jgi:hypothetical protein
MLQNLLHNCRYSYCINAPWLYLGAQPDFQVFYDLLFLSLSCAVRIVSNSSVDGETSSVLPGLSLFVDKLGCFDCHNSLDYLVVVP